MDGLVSHAKDFLLHCKIAKNLSPKTIVAYTTDLQQVSSYLLSEFQVVDVKSVDKEMLRTYLATLFEKLKPKSVKRKIASLKAFFNFLEQDDIIAVNPLRKLRIKIKEPFVLPNYLTLKEISIVLKKADSQRREANKKVGSKEHLLALRNLAVLEMLFATGIRVSELSNLRNNHVDLQAGTIRVVGKGNKERLIHFGHEATLKTITRYVRHFQPSILASGYFFVNQHGNRLSTQTVRSIIKQIALDANLNRHITPHAFRHTFATLLMEEGVDIKYIQQFLGHSSIMTTQIYTHVSRRKQEEILLKLHPRGRI